MLIFYLLIPYQLYRLYKVYKLVFLCNAEHLMYFCGLDFQK
jgi:hypothetical protein